MNSVSASFSFLLKFLIVDETLMFLRMSLSRTCHLNARLCDILVIPMAFLQFPAFVHLVLWVCDKLEHALISFAYYISTKNSWQALFTNRE